MSREYFTAFKIKQSGVSLIELVIGMVLTGALLAPLIIMQSSTLQTGQSIKMATTKMVHINNLIEGAASTGTLQGIGSTLNLTTIPAGGQTTYPAAPVQFTSSLSKDTFWYQWSVRDSSYQVDSNGNLILNNGNPIPVSPTGNRVYSAALEIYDQPGNSVPSDVFLTTLQTTAPDPIPEKPGVMLLFDNSDSMHQAIVPSAAMNMYDVPGTMFPGTNPPYLVYDDYPGTGSWLTYSPGELPNAGPWFGFMYDPSVPDMLGDTIPNPPSAGNWQSEYLGTQVQNYMQQEAGKGINYCRTTYPHLTFRYGGVANDTFVNTYVPASERLNPFDNTKIDLTFQSSYAGSGSNPNRTYPGPGVLGMPNSGAAGACDAAPAQWNQSPANIAEYSHFFSWYAATGVLAVANNMLCTSEFQCTCQPMQTYLNNGGELWDPTTQYANGQYTGPQMVGPGGFTDFLSLPHCMYTPLVPPFTNAPYIANLWGFPANFDIRQPIVTACQENPTTDPNFDAFTLNNLNRIEMARNSVLKFFMALETDSTLINSGEMGFQPFNPTDPSQNIPLGPATNTYLSLHPTQPALFENIRLTLLGINRYGAAGPACIYPFEVTPMYDRLYDAAQALASDNTLTTRIVVLFTDGQPEGPGVDPGYTTDPNGIAAMVQSQYNQAGKPITLFSIGIAGNPPDPTADASLAQLQLWSQASPNGSSYTASNNQQLDAAFIGVANLIELQILLDQLKRYNINF